MILPRAPARPAKADLNIREFRIQLLDHGFAYLGATVDRFVDLQFPRGGYLEPVKNGRKTLRRETLAALLAARTKSRAGKKCEQEALARQQAVAAAIAPTALPPARAGLADAAAIAQLSDDFIILSARNESADIGDLLLLGWQRDQVNEYLDAARTLAYRRQDAVPA